jgi:hypothetical protein
MKAKLGQESAFPSLEFNEPGYGNCITLEFGDVKHFIPFEKGMSKRFYAACAAMQGLMANPKMFDNMLDFKSTSVKELIIERCYDYADEMLKQENQ